MTPEDLVTYVNHKAKIDNTVDFTDMLLVTNAEKDDLCARINKVNPNFYATYGHDDLVANQREYDQPSDVLATLKAVFLKLNGTDFIRATWIDLNDRNFVASAGADPLNMVSLVQQGLVFQEDWITARFTNDNPYVFTYRQSIFVLSGTITAVTDGVQLWYGTTAADLPNLTESSVDLSTATDNSATVPMGIPTQFHRLLGDKIVINYKEAKELPLTIGEQRIDAKIDDLIEQMANPNQDQTIRGSIPFSTGSNF